MDFTRRSALRGSLASAALIAIAGTEPFIDARQARAAGLPLTVLSDAQATTLEALGDRLVPGAATRGLAFFVDHQISLPASESLLLLKYLGVDPPYADFYKSGLLALEMASQTIYGNEFHGLSDIQQDNLITSMENGSPQGWSGVPAPLFYLAVRSDAVDVVYGTVDGFTELGIPYMAHIYPPRSF